MSCTPLQLAEAFIQYGELNDTLQALSIHLEANPADDAARRLRAAVAIRMREEAHFRLAVSDLNQISEPTPDDDVNRAIALEYLADLDGAMLAVERARAARPQDERIAERYFFMLLARRRFAEAQSLLETMPRTWDWLQKAGDLASEADGPEQAIALYSQALDHLDTQFDASVDAFARPLKANLLASRAHTYAAAGQFPEADADYTAAEALMPDDAMLAFWHSFIAADLGDHARAVDLCRAAYEKAGEGWRAQMVETLKIMRDSGRYAALADAILSL